MAKGVFKIEKGGIVSAGIDTVKLFIENGSDEDKDSIVLKGRRTLNVGGKYNE